MNSEDITIESNTGPREGVRLSCSSFALTDIGCKRLHNEDAYLASNSKGLWAVADGMGGHDAGDLASSTLMHNLDRIMLDDALEGSVDLIEASIKASNQQLQQIASDTDAITSIGSTIAMMAARGSHGIILWAGDSRVYRIRKENLEQVTRDHSVVNDLIDKGILDEQGAARHPDRNMITRSIGINDEVDIDRRNVSILAGDRYLLCSDGLTRHISDEQLAMIASPEVNPRSSTAVKALIKAALDAGTSDNITVVIVDFVEAR